MFALGENDLGRDEQQEDGAVQQQAPILTRTPRPGAKDQGANSDREKGRDKDQRGDDRLDGDAERARKRHRRNERQEGRRRVRVGDVDIGNGAVDDLLGESDEPGHVAVDVAGELLGDRDADEEQRDPGAGENGRQPRRLSIDNCAAPGEEAHLRKFRSA